jgi:uncharacterized membrane protein required for colicin V production
MELTVIDMVLLGLVLAGGACGLAVGAVRIAGPFAVLVALLTLVHAYPELSTRLGTHPTARLFLPLLAGFVGLVVYGFVIRILLGAVPVSLGIMGRLLGLGLGLITGTVLAGALVWWLKTHAGLYGMVLLHNSTLASVAIEFFQVVMAFTQRLFPRHKPEQEPWWKKPLW